MSTRILGPCPVCAVEDSIQAGSGEDAERWREAFCESCNTTWPDCFDLVESEHSKLILVGVDVSQTHAVVNGPYDLYDRPFARLVVTVLNVALMVRFKLRTCCASEGGIQGSISGHYMELTNGDRELGLYLDNHYITDGPPQRVLGWYARLLEQLFLEELKVDGESVGRGAILKLDSSDLAYWERTRALLAAALEAHTGSRGFASTVFKRVSAELSGRGVNYIAGLTDDDVVQLFVPPPLLVHDSEEEPLPDGTTNIN